MMGVPHSSPKVMEVSSIFLNYADVRNLVGYLGKPRQQSEYYFAIDKIIADGFRTNHYHLRQGVMDPSGSPGTGVNLTEAAYFTLRKAVGEMDLSKQKHTRRLAIVAEAMGWKADALMHFLKTTTGKLGRNETLKKEFFSSLSHLMGQFKAAQWEELLRTGGPGLYLIVGNPGNGIGTTLGCTIKAIAGGQSVMTTTADYLDASSMAHPSPVIFEENDANILAVNIFTAAGAFTALKAAEKSIVIATYQASSFTEAYHRLQDLTVGTGTAIPQLRGCLTQKMVWTDDPSKRLVADVVIDRVDASSYRSQTVPVPA